MRSRTKVGAAVLAGALLAGGTVTVARAVGAEALGASNAATAAPGAGDAPGAGTNGPGAEKTAPVMLYDGGLSPDWKDLGWAQRELPKGAPARMRLFNYAGWILYRPKLEGTFGALSFRFSAPESFGEFLEVRLDAPGAASFPRVPIIPELQVRKDGEWSEIVIPMEQLNPRGQPFDRVVLRASKSVGREWVLFDKVSLVPLPPELAAALAAGADARARAVAAKRR